MLSVTPNAVIGRIQALIETVLFGASLISASLAGVLGQVLPISIIFLGSGVLIVLSGILGWLVLPSQAQKLEWCWVGWGSLSPPVVGFKLTHHLHKNPYGYFRGIYTKNVLGDVQIR